MKPLFVSHWWGDAYAKKAQKLTKQYKKFGLDHYVKEVKRNEKENYQLAINTKPQFMLDMLQKHERPIVYVDVDMNIHKKPQLFDHLHNYDIACFNWNADHNVTRTVDPYVLETCSTVVAFGYTKPAINLLKKWILKLKNPKYKNMADDRVLSMLIHDEKLVEHMRCLWLPLNYACYMDLFQCKAPVITHPDPITSEKEAHKLGAVKNRIPKDYTLYRSITNRNLKNMSGEMIPYVQVRKISSDPDVVGHRGSQKYHIHPNKSVKFSEYALKVLGKDPVATFNKHPQYLVALRTYLK